MDRDHCIRRRVDVAPVARGERRSQHVGQYTTRVDRQQRGFRHAQRETHQRFQQVPQANHLLEGRPTCEFGRARLPVIGADSGIRIEHSRVDAVRFEHVKQRTRERRRSEFTIEHVEVGFASTRLGDTLARRTVAAERRIRAEFERTELAIAELVQRQQTVRAAIAGRIVSDVDARRQIHRFRAQQRLVRAQRYRIAGERIGRAHLVSRAGDRVREQREPSLDIEQIHRAAGHGRTTSTTSATACCTVPSSDTACTMPISHARRASIPRRISLPV